MEMKIIKNLAADKGHGYSNMLRIDTAVFCAMITSLGNANHVSEKETVRSDNVLHNVLPIDHLPVL